MSKIGSIHTDFDGRQETPQGQSAGAASPPKNQLARRVEARIKELETAFESAQDDPARQKQARAIALALKGARDSMNLRGDHMGPIEARQMTRWLESTQYLVPTKP